tara:strand:- start:1438 stop:1584 length:147 start_codon:yes stop_codon:yes gene_type:complete
MKNLTWRKIEDRRMRERRILKLKEIGQLFLIVAIGLIAMAVGGMTYPY